MPLYLPLDYPTHATMWFDEFTVSTGALTVILESLQRYGFQVFPSAHSNGLYIETTISLAAGSYTFSVLGQTESDACILDWTIDGVAVLTGQDWYSAGVVRNVVQTGTITVTKSGTHILRGTVNGKNASSTDFYFILTKAWLR